MNHFQRLNAVKELKIFFFAQRTNTRKQAFSRRPLPCDALAPTVQNRAGAWCPGDTSALRAEYQQLYNRKSLTSRAHRGSLSKRRELVLSSLPTPSPFFSPILGPRSLKLRVSFPCICSPPVCIIRSVTSLSLATTIWSPEHPFFSTHCYPNTSSDVTCVLGESSFPVTTHGFFPEGLLLSGQGGCLRRPYQGWGAHFPSYLLVEN